MWLETLGSMQVNWKTQVMKFNVRGTGMVLKGDTSLSKSQVSLKAILRTIRHEGNGIYLELSLLVSEEIGVVTAVGDERLQALLQKHSAVLHMPTGLPPC